MALTTNLSMNLDAIIGAGPNNRQAVKAALTLVDTEFGTDQAAIAVLQAAVGSVLTGSKTHDFANLVDGARDSTTVTVTGAAFGDYVVGVSVSVDAAGGVLSGYVSAANTVTVDLLNETGAALDLASATLRVLVRKA